MSRSSTTGFIHIKDYYSSKSNNITPCASTECYQIKKSNVKCASNISISTAHLVLDYFERYHKDNSLIHQEWLELNEEYKNEKFNNPSESYCLSMFYFCDYNPELQVYILQSPPVVNYDDFWSYVESQKTTRLVYIQTQSNLSSASIYWPEEGSHLYGNIEVTTVSVHESQWYVTRNFFIKNIVTNQTNTLTQFHFISWPTLVKLQQIEDDDKNQELMSNFLLNLLQLRREFRFSFSERQRPILIQSDDVAGAGGCFMVLDSILMRLGNGAREIDLVGCISHFRDQCVSIVTKEQDYRIILEAIATQMLCICKRQDF